MAIIQFDQVARAERYFADTLLPHLLMADDFTRLKILFAHVYPSVNFANYVGSFELVSELDPLRDSAISNPVIRKLFQLHKRIAVPDLFLRWGDYCIVVEANFFTDPLDIAINQQLASQQDAISKVKAETIYSKMDIIYLAISITEYKNLTNSMCLTWKDLLDVITKNCTVISSDQLYC